MTDNKQLIEQLRESSIRQCKEAADTIERLEAELREISESLQAESNNNFAELEQAEAKLATLEAERERDAAVLEGMTSDEVAEKIAYALWLSDSGGPSSAYGFHRDRDDAVHKRFLALARISVQAALQHAQEQVGENDGG